MFCSNCGTEAIGAYCSNCGAKIQNINPISAPDRREPVTRANPSILAKSKDCSTVLDESHQRYTRDKLFSLVFTEVASLCCMNASQIYAILTDKDPDRVETPSLLVVIGIVGMVIGIWSLVTLIKRGNAVFNKYKEFCAKEMLIIDELKVYGATIYGNFELPFEKIKSIDYTVHRGTNTKDSLPEPFCDVLRIRDTTGKTYEFHSFINCKELAMLGEKQMKEVHLSSVTIDPIAKATSSTVSAENKAAPIQPEFAGNDIICPACGTMQRGNRKLCWSCGQEFAK